MPSYKVVQNKVIEVHAFQVPNYVIPLDNREDSLRLAAVSAETLSKMCDEFRAQVFLKAACIDPRPLP